MTIEELLNLLTGEDGIVFLENGQKKSFDQLHNKTLIINTLIAKADGHYRYVFDEPMVQTTNDSFELIAFLFVYDALFMAADNNSVNVETLIGEEDNG